MASQSPRHGRCARQAVSTKQHARRQLPLPEKVYDASVLNMDLLNVVGSIARKSIGADAEQEPRALSSHTSWQS